MNRLFDCYDEEFSHSLDLFRITIHRRGSLGRRCCETLLRCRFKWQPNIPTAFHAQGQRGTGQIRRRVKEDENGIGIAGARSFSSNTGGGGWGSKQIGRGLSHAPFRRNKARDAWQKTTRQGLSTVQADRVTNRAGKDLNRSFGLADRGRPRECQYSPGLLSAWQGTDVGNPACA